MEIDKIYINYFVLLFILNVLLLCIFFSSFYMTHHNYKLYEYDTKNNTKTKTNNFIIKPNDELLLEYCKYHNNLLKLTNPNSNNICVIFTNSFKSENISVTPHNLIKLIDSDLIIHNNTKNNMNIMVEIYKI